MESRSLRKKLMRISPRHLIPLSFLLAILLGTMLLLLPAATAPGNSTDFITALFTATTSVCVTGLTVETTAAHWSPFGQAVILLLIQIGGLGVVAIVSLLALLLKKRLSLAGRTLIRDAFGLETRSGLLRFLLRVARGTLVTEGIGALLYLPFFLPAYGIRGLWIALFTAVSAFCNAGIDLFGAESLTPWGNCPPVVLTTSALIILGGLGFVVWFDLPLLRKGKREGMPFSSRFSRLSEHTRLVLLLTGFLLLSGTLVFFFSERRNPGTLASLPAGQALLQAFFQSVTLRTAGFSLFPQENLTAFSSLAACLLMFIGGSPIGTAGGIKTVTAFLFLLNADSFIRGRSETLVLRRRVPGELIGRACAIVTVSAAAVLSLTGLLLLLEPVKATDALFETLSACATVGLSRSLTPCLGAAGRLTIIFAMFLGRIGPLSMAVFFTRTSPEKGRIRYAPGRFFVG